MKKNQRGFLLVVAIVLIVVVGLISAVLVSLLGGSASTNINIARADRALYIATSGLELTKRAVGINGVACNAINGSAQFTNVAFGGGEFNVTTVPNLAVTELNGNITATATSIPLVSLTGFNVNGGVAMIGSEIVSYTGVNVSDNSLIGVIRGVAGTIAGVHGIGSGVAQNQCVVDVVAGVPNLAAAEGRRSLKQVLTTSGFALFGLTPSLASVGAVDLLGTADVVNPAVTFASDNYAGSTILSGGEVTLSGNATTRVNSESGLVVSSDASLERQDIMENVSALTSGNLFGYFFNQPKATIAAGADVIINSNLNDLTPLSGHEGQLIWVNGKVQESGMGGASVVVGSPLNPAILVIDGDLRLLGNSTLTVYGLVYVTGKIDVGGTANLEGQGTIASESTVELSGTALFNFDPGIITRLSILNPNVNIGYGVTLTRPGEVFN